MQQRVLVQISSKLKNMNLVQENLVCTDLVVDYLPFLDITSRYTKGPLRDEDSQALVAIRPIKFRPIEFRPIESRPIEFPEN